MWCCQEGVLSRVGVFRGVVLSRDGGAVCGGDGWFCPGGGELYITGSDIITPPPPVDRQMLLKILPFLAVSNYKKRELIL